MLKKTGIILIGLLLLTGLAGCGKKAGRAKTETQGKQEETESQGKLEETEVAAGTENGGNDGTEEMKETTAEVSDTEEQTAESLINDPEELHAYVTDADEQISLIVERFPVWHDEELSQEKFMYAVTDLDHNGRLEVLMSALEGTGLYTHSEIYEVSEDRSKLVHINWEKEAGFSEPDIIVDAVNAYYDPEKNTYHYIFDDLLRVSNMESQDSVCAFTYADGKVQVEWLASLYQTVNEDGESVNEEYRDASGAEIAPDEYFEAAEKRFASLKPVYVQISWFENNEGGDLDASVRMSWENFQLSDR